MAKNLIINGTVYPAVDKIKVISETGEEETFIIPDGTGIIEENGTYDVKQLDSVDVSVRNGTHNLHYEVTNPSSITGGDNFFTAVSNDERLAQIRNLESLVVMYRTSGTISCVVSSISANQTNYLPLSGYNGHYQGALRLNSEGGYNYNGTYYPINDNTEIRSGSGRVYITENGDLRIYGNTSGYAIPAGKITIDVLWGDE